MPVPIKLCHLVKPIYPKQLLEAKLHSSSLASLLCPVVEIASRAAFRIGVRGMVKDDVFISEETNLLDDVDNLWKQASKNYDVILVRTHDYLQWRYVANPDTYSILIARNRSGAISGYMVTKLAGSGDKNIGFIVDYLTLEDNPHVFGRLLATSLERFFERKVNLVHTWIPKGNFYYRGLLKVGFLPYKNVPLLCYQNDIGNKILGQACKWHFTMGDSDSV